MGDRYYPYGYSISYPDEQTQGVLTQDKSSNTETIKPVYKLKKLGSLSERVYPKIDNCLGIYKDTGRRSQVQSSPFRVTFLSLTSLVGRPARRMAG